LITRNPTAWR